MSERRLNRRLLFGVGAGALFTQEGPRFEVGESSLVGDVELRTLLTPAACSLKIAQPELFGNLKRVKAVSFYSLPYVRYPGQPRLGIPQVGMLEEGVTLSTNDTESDPIVTSLYSGGGRYGNLDVPVPFVLLSIEKPGQPPIEVAISTASQGRDQLHVYTQIYNANLGVPLDKVDMEFVSPILTRTLAALLKSRDNGGKIDLFMDDPEVLAAANNDNGPAIRVSGPGLMPSTASQGR